jgi:hypothetical protein
MFTSKVRLTLQLLFFKPMEKFMFTADGVMSYNAKLYALDDAKLTLEVSAFATDPIAYLSENFELAVGHLEYLRDISEHARTIFSWSLGAALLARRPVTIRIIHPGSEKLPADACLLLSSTQASHYAATSLDNTGNCELTLTW